MRKLLSTKLNRSFYLSEGESTETATDGAPVFLHDEVHLMKRAKVHESPLELLERIFDTKEVFGCRVIAIYADVEGPARVLDSADPKPTDGGGARTVSTAASAPRPFSQARRDEENLERARKYATAIREQLSLKLVR